MTVEAPAEGDAAVPEEEPSAKPQARRPVERRVAAAALVLLPGVLIVFFGFNGGGFFPGSVGFATLFVSQLLVVRVLVADAPFAGFSRPLAVVALLMALFTGWTLASALWSDAEARALVEFDRALLYLLLLVLMGLLPRRAYRAMWIVRATAVGAFVVCTAGLVSRVLPHVWPTSPGVSNNRLSFPLTYWNAFGILATVGLILAVALTTSDRESRLSRSLAAAAVPVLATALLFTFSRGAMAVGIVGLVVYLVVARQRALVAGLIAVVPTAVVALVVAYGADQLATLDPANARGVAQGKDVALALAICVLVAGVARFLLAPLDRRMARLSISGARRRRISLGLAGAAAFVIVVALAAGGASWVGDQYHGFVKGGAVTGSDLRQRLIDPSSNGRTDHWRAAFDGFSEEPLHGTGAGTYQFSWERHRKVLITVVDAHGLYFEVLSELGVVGLALLLAVILSVLVAFARRSTGLNRGYYAALLGAGIAWALHAGVDWDWEMPAVTAWFFAAGGAALAARQRTKERGPAPQIADGNRITIAAALLVTAVTPALLMLSQTRLSDAASKFNHGDCRGASSAALSSLDYMAVRPEPYQMIGYCDLDQGRLTQAVAAMRKAVGEQPRNWEYHFSLAIALAESGKDPRQEYATAARLNPLEPSIKEARSGLGSASAADWPKAGLAARREILGSGRLTLK
jgi:O-antigen ligase